MPLPKTNTRALPLESVPDTIELERMTARVIEIGELTAGIAVPEHGGVRFYSSERGFDALDGTLFRSFEQATRAARERARSSGGRSSGGRNGLPRQAAPRLMAG